MARKWHERKEYYRESGKALPNTASLTVGDMLWVKTTFGHVYEVTVKRIGTQYAWCSQNEKIRLSNLLVEHRTLHWHGRAYGSKEAAEVGDMPMSLNQFSLLVALGESPDELYLKGGISS